MNLILIAVASVTVVGIVCGVMLAVASKFMAVKTDERVDAIRACLPGANCGACGFAGCDGYAHALREEEGVKTNLCVPGADAVSQEISNILGVAFEDVIEKVAVVCCQGDCSATENKQDYQGIAGCAAAKLFFGGVGTCTFGCMGLGDCARVCPQGAICIENGLAHVDTRKCTGCGMCARTCPNHVISILSDVEVMVVECNNTEKGAVTRKKCTKGCIGCKKCERECPADAIKVENNLARIDYDKCQDCGHCAEICTVGCIDCRSLLGAHKS